MRNIGLFIVTLAVLPLTSACGSSKAEKKALPSPTPVKTANANLVTANVPPPSNAIVVTGNVAQASNSAAPTVGNATDEKPAVRDRRRQRVDINPSATPVPPNFQKAAENSEFAIYMDREGAVIEIRLFKDHAQLQKVEVKWLDPKLRLIKAVLKDGKVVELKSSQPFELRNISSAELMSIIGVTAKTGKADRRTVSPKR